MLQSRPEDITAQEVGRQEEGEDEGEVDDCITEHITHVSRASTIEGFGNTTDASSTEHFVDPISTEEYIKSSFEEKNTGEKQSESAGVTQPVEMVVKTQLSEMKQKDVPNVLRNKDLRKMVLEKHKKRKEENVNWH